LKKIATYGFYAFGFNYACLKNQTLKNQSAEYVLNLFDLVFSDLESLDLQVVSLMAKDLKKIVTSIRESNVKTISAEVAEKIEQELNKLDPALDAEMKLKGAYLLTKKRYPLETLLNDISPLFAAGVFAKLSDNAKQDYQLACMQIALSQPTAAAFHLMRALEGEVKRMYFHFKRTKRLERPMWGPMISQLRAKRAPKPSEKLMSHLDGMRVHFRNPTQHPDLFYSLDEAQDLLNQTITATNMISAELP
jgi:hypothetical protein